MSFTPPTTLPSIQFLLAQETSEDRKFTKGHRSTRSVSSLPSELQNLSLNGPSQGTSPSKDDTQIPKAQPSWMNGPPPPPSTATLASNSPSSSASSSSTQHPPSITHHRHHHHHHQRSISDLSMTTPTASSSLSSTIHPISFHSFNNFHHTPNHQMSTTPSIASPLQSSLSPPHRNHHQHQRHLSHRRAISATTVDHIIQPPSSSSASTPPPVPLIPFYHRAHSSSPPENYLPFSNTNAQSVDAFMDRPNAKQDPILSTATAAPTTSAPTYTNPLAALSSTTPNSLPPHDASGGQQQNQPTHAVVNGMELPRDISGRYLCPFCQKAFSRPSSLRIHTYSHTKEKPFACPECPRQFSVQSNMRRHLRIHLIRPTNKTAF